MVVTAGAVDVTPRNDSPMVSDHVVELFARITAACEASWLPTSSKGPQTRNVAACLDLG